MVSNAVIVLAIVAGAGFVLLCGFASTRFFFGDSRRDDLTLPGTEFNQAAYMREVRIRGQESVAGSLGHHKQHLVGVYPAQNSRPKG